MRTLVLLTVFLCFVSCETEQAEFNVIEKEPQIGFVSVSGEVFSQETDGKTPVPECSNETPMSIRYVYRNNAGTTFERSSGISMSGNNFTAIQEMALPIGDYDVEIVELLSGTGTVTHVVPNEIDPRFPFANYVDNPLPYPITVTADAVYQDSPQMMCYTAPDVVFEGEVGFSGSAIELTTLVVYVVFREVENCAVNEIGITIGGRETIVLVEEEIPYIIPIPLGATFTIKAYFNGTQRTLSYQGELVDQITDVIFYTTEEIPNLDTRDITYFIQPVCPGE